MNLEENESNNMDLSVFDFPDDSSSETIHSSSSSEMEEEKELGWFANHEKEIELSGNTPFEEVSEYYEQDMSMDIDLQPYLFFGHFFEMMSLRIFPLLKKFYLESFNVLVKYKTKKRGVNAMRESRSLRSSETNEDSTHPEEMGFERKKQIIFNRINVRVRKNPTNELWCRFIGSLLLSLVGDTSSIRKSVKKVKEEYDAVNIMSARSIRSYLKIFFGRDVYGHQVLTDRTEQLFYAFNSTYYEHMETRGIHFDESFPRIRGTGLPHRISIFGKPNNSGMWVYAAAFFSGSVCYLRFKRRDRFRRDTPPWSRYLFPRNRMEKPKYDLKSVFSHFLDFQEFPDEKLIVADKYYCARNSVELLSNERVDFLFSCKDRNFRIPFDYLSRNRDARLEQVLNARFNGSSVKFGFTTHLNSANNRNNNYSSRSQRNSTDSRVVMSGKIGECNLNSVSDFYTKYTRKVDTANSLVLNLLPQFRLNWARRMFIMVILYCVYNSWVFYRQKLLLLQKKYPRSQTARISPMTYKKFLVSIGLSLLGKTSRDWKRFIHKISRRHRFIFQARELIRSKSRNYCIVCRPKCNRKVQTRCSNENCRRMCCIMGLMSHKCQD